VRYVWMEQKPVRSQTVLKHLELFDVSQGQRQQICTIKIWAMNNTYYEPGFGVGTHPESTRPVRQTLSKPIKQFIYTIHLFIWSTFYRYVYVSLWFIRKGQFFGFW